MRETIVLYILCQSVRAITSDFVCRPGHVVVREGLLFLGSGRTPGPNSPLLGAVLLLDVSPSDDGVVLIARGWTGDKAPLPFPFPLVHAAADDRKETHNNEFIAARQTDFMPTLRYAPLPVASVQAGRGPGRGG